MRTTRTINKKVIKKMKRIRRILVVVVYTLCSQLISAGLVSLSPARVSAQGECSVGFYPKNTSLITNGDFATVPTDITPGGDPGTSFSSPGFFYSNANFYSQMANMGTDIYPDDTGPINAFSAQVGNYVGGILNQVTFPGDPTYTVPASNTWLYTNGNAHNGTEYLNWEQDVSGLVIGKKYVFVSYISNVIDPPQDSPDDPTMKLRIGGTSGLPDGTVAFGPTVLTEAGTSNASALNGWQRVAVSFTAANTTEKLKITDSSTGSDGDDFAMTAIQIQECAPSPDYGITLSHSAAPSTGSSFTETVTVDNAGNGDGDQADSLTLNLPTGYTVNGGASGSVTLTNNASNYSCSSNGASPQTITCSSATIIASGGSQSFQFNLAVGSAASVSAQIQGSVVVAHDEVSGNDTDTDSVGVAPDIKNTLTVLSHTDSSLVLESKVENIGTGYTSGNTTIALSLVNGVSVNNGAAGSVTLAGANASDWACTSDASSPQTISCTHSQVMQNSNVSDQLFTITLAYTGSLSNVTFTSVASASNDSNPSNNTSTSNFTSTVPPSDPGTGVLATTGIRMLMQIGFGLLLLSSTLFLIADSNGHTYSFFKR